MTPNIAKKIAAISETLPALAKTTNNADAGFRYASIDEYYSKIAGLVRTGGLIWTISEENCEFVKLGDEWFARFTYLFQIFDLEESSSDIDGAQVIGRWASGFSLVHPLQGAQTTGSAMSYAEKIFLRTLFKVVTGEPDADAFAKPKQPKRNPQPAEVDDDAFGGGVERKPAAKASKPSPPPVKPASSAASAPEEEIQVADDANLPPASEDLMIAARVNVLIGSLAQVGSKLELKAWKDDPKNASWIEAVKAGPESEWSRLEAAFSDKLAELKQPKKGGR